MKLKKLLVENTNRPEKKKIEEQVSDEFAAKMHPLWFVSYKIADLSDSLTALSKRATEYLETPEFDEWEADPNGEIRERSRKVALGFMKKVNDSIKQYQDIVKLISNKK